jgi:hypothetical protein
MLTHASENPYGRQSLLPNEHHIYGGISLFHLFSPLTSLIRCYSPRLREWPALFLSLLSQALLSLLHFSLKQLKICESLLSFFFLFLCQMFPPLFPFELMVICFRDLDRSWLYLIIIM